MRRVAGGLKQSDGLGALRCEYRSAAQALSGGLWGRQSLRRRASAATCDEWAFNPGQNITLLAFDYPLPTGTPAIQQHQRWFATMELAIPKPASFRVPGVQDTLADEATLTTIANNSNDWMSFMGRL